MSGDTTGGPGRRRGHLRGVRGQAGTHDEHEAGGDGVDDDSFSVPDLLATDALLDRLGRHETTDGDLADAVARLLDSYALHADPETAGVRAVELPDLDAAAEPVHAPAPRVLLARRRTLQRLGRGTVAAAAVLTLLGGTAAAAATSTGPLGGAGGGVSASIASQLPGWFPDTVFSVFAGSATERAQREIVQARADALAGDSEGARARLKYLQRQLGTTAVDPQVVQQVQQVLADLEDDDLDGLAGTSPTGTPTGSPTTSPVPSPTGTSLADVATVTPTASPTGTWRVPLQPGRTTGTATSTTPAAPVTPSAPPAAEPGTGGTPPRTSPPAAPVTPPPVVVPDVPSGGAGAPSTPVTTDPPATQAPDPSTEVPGGTPTDPGTGTPTGTPTDAAPTDPGTPTGGESQAPDPGTTTEPAPGTTDGSAGGGTGAPADPVATDPGAGTAPVVVTPTLPVVLPSPTTGEVPVPGVSTDGGDPAGATDPAVVPGS